MDSSPLLLATSGPAKRRKHYFCLSFSQYWTWAEKSQWSRHLFEKSIPGLFYSKPPRKVSATELELRTTQLNKPKKNRPTCFQTLTCLVQSGVHPPGFPKDFLWISQGFPMDFPPPSLNFRGGRGSGRQISRPGSLGRASLTTEIILWDQMGSIMGIL